MSSPSAKLVTPASLFVDAILCAGFFAALFAIVKSHVPSNDPSMVYLWAGLTAGCMTGVFWLAVQMFRIVLRVHREDRRK